MYARVQAEAFGAFPESLLNALGAAGVELWKIEKKNENTLSFEFYESQTETVKRYADRCAVELKLHHVRENKRRVLKKRYGLLLISCAMGLALLASSLFVWQIDIHGNRSISRGELLRALEDSGMGLGSFWPGLKADEIRSRVMLLLPDIGWMSVNISGSRAVVLLSERQEKPEIYRQSQPGDMVASKSGLVRRVSVLQGKAAVEPQQAVVEGELLISGTLDSIMGTERTVRSRGSVMAETCYEIDAICPKQQQMKTDRGIARHRFALVFGKRRINFYISSGKAIDEYDKIINEYTLGLDGHFASPVRLVHECIIPYDSAPGEDWDSETVGRKLLSILDSQTEGQILQSSLTESEAGDLRVLTLRAHCMENIARAQPRMS